MSDCVLTRASNICQLWTCVKKVEGLESTSASPTDIWIIYFKPDTTYYGKELESAYLKIAVNPNYIDSEANRGLEYERRVYKEVTDVLLERRVCPHFVRGLLTGDMCHFDDLLRVAKAGISADLILCFLRHLSEAEALQTLEDALPWRSHFIGVGLDSSERGHPPEKFARVFARAGELGLHRVAHAGEEGPPAYIESALDVLHAERIDHGVRCTESPELVRRLAAAGTPLTVCPLSNVKLCVFPDLASHNLPALLAAGLKVNLNSDDPAYFGGYLLDNWLGCFEALPLSRADAVTLARNSLEASFAPAAERQAWLAQLDIAATGR